MGDMAFMFQNDRLCQRSNENYLIIAILRGRITCPFMNIAAKNANLYLKDSPSREMKKRFNAPNAVKRKSPGY